MNLMSFRLYDYTELSDNFTYQLFPFCILGSGATSLCQLGNWLYWFLCLNIIKYDENTYSLLYLRCLFIEK